MAKVQLPNNWRPRDYQLPAWEYLEAGGRHAELIWHRRSGKDEIALHYTATAAFKRVATYWHMLPVATQARKAIWEAINPHTGMRRIDEAFPHAIRATTREQEMMIKFVNGSTWQVVGSDNYNNMVGSPPAGIVYSEWALANPSARAYLRPIIAENDGWQIFITTPRGKNHAHRTYKAGLKNPSVFAQSLSAVQTGALTAEKLEAERLEYIGDFGEDQGEALFEQEYLVSFEAALLGAYYGKEINKARAAGRIGKVAHDPSLPVYTAWDIGFSDDTVIIFFQVAIGEVRIIDHYEANGHGVDYYCDVLKEKKAYRYERHWLPHDAQAKLFAAKGRTVVQQMADEEITNVIVLPNKHTEQQGILSVRKMFPKLWIDEDRCEKLIDAVSQFRREWDDERKCFKDKPIADWTNHSADALRYLSWVWKEPNKPVPKKPEKVLTVGQPSTVTLEDLYREHAREQNGRI